MPDFSLPAVEAAEALRRAAAGEALMVDFRKPAAVAAAGVLVRGAVRRDPFAFGHDDPLVAEARPVIVFCVHGHEVSRFACALLLMHGRDAAYVRGGFEALRAAGAPLEPLP